MNKPETKKATPKKKATTSPKKKVVKKVQQKNTEKTIAFVVYALQILAFVNGITAIIGVVMNYVKLDDVKDTWLESHFRWQIKTFWFGLLWSIVGFVTIFIFIGWIILFANMIWIIYRIVKGLIQLNEGKAVE